MWANHTSPMEHMGMISRMLRYEIAYMAQRCFWRDPGSRLAESLREARAQIVKTNLKHQKAGENQRHLQKDISLLKSCSSQNVQWETVMRGVSLALLNNQIRPSHLDSFEVVLQVSARSWMFMMSWWRQRDVIITPRVFQLLFEVSWSLDAIPIKKSNFGHIGSGGFFHWNFPF